jgi:hypothetical protein
MKSPTGTHTSNAGMIRTGWVLSGFSSAFIIVDGLGKLLPPTPGFLEGDSSTWGVCEHARPPRHSPIRRAKDPDLIFLVPVRGCEKECSLENIEFVGIAA